MKPKILVLSGGGMKGIAILGALSILDKYNILENINIYAGTSVGAIICSFLVCGYKPDELFNKILDKKSKHFAKINIINFVKQVALNNGQDIQKLFIKLLQEKNIDIHITLRELYTRTKKLLILTTTCINTKKCVYLSHLDFPDLKLIEAMRMTSAFPLFFSPIIYKNKLYCDGGCTNAYPANIFKKYKNDIIGIHLVPESNTVYEINTIEDYILNVFQTILLQYFYLESREYENETIEINTSSIDTLSFNMNKQTKTKIFNCGVESALNYLSRK